MVGYIYSYVSFFLQFVYSFTVVGVSCVKLCGFNSVSCYMMGDAFFNFTHAFILDFVVGCLATNVEQVLVDGV